MTKPQTILRIKLSHTLPLLLSSAPRHFLSIIILSYVPACLTEREGTDGETWVCGNCDSYTSHCKWTHWHLVLYISLVWVWFRHIIPKRKIYFWCVDKSGVRLCPTERQTLKCRKFIINCLSKKRLRRQPDDFPCWYLTWLMGVHDFLLWFLIWLLIFNEYYNWWNFVLFNKYIEKVEYFGRINIDSFLNQS